MPRILQRTIRARTCMSFAAISLPFTTTTRFRCSNTCGFTNHAPQILIVASRNGVIGRTCGRVKSATICSARAGTRHEHAKQGKKRAILSASSSNYAHIGSLVDVESIIQKSTTILLSFALCFCTIQPAPAYARKYTTEEQLTIDIFQKNTPSVVNVTNLATRRDAFTLNTLEVPQGAGSGFIWDKDGHVVTNYHVISDASDIQVTLTGGAEYTAKVVGVDQDKDIAVLEIQASDTKPVDDLKPLGLCSSSADLVVGQRVYAIGNPFGLDHTLTTGVVSGTGREIQSISGRPIQDVIQTDAAINPGNSGGPLLDTAGCLIGINTAIFSPSGANSGVGFAIPVDIVKSSVNQIIQFGKVVRPVLGISFAPDQSSEQLGVKGILVLSAKEGGPAFKAGVHGTTRDSYGRLVLGDIITGINGANIRNASDLYRILDKANVGDTLDVEVLRGNTKEHVDIVLEANA